MSEDTSASSLLIPPANEVWGKVMFIHRSVILFTGGCTPPPEMATEAGGTHPTGMHSCFHPRMRVMSMCLSVQAITFEPLDIETSFLVCRYILTISRSSLSIKVIKLRSYEKKMLVLLISTC